MQNCFSDSLCSILSFRNISNTNLFELTKSLKDAFFPDFFIGSIVWVNHKKTENLLPAGAAM